VLEALRSGTCGRWSTERAAAVAELAESAYLDPEEWCRRAGEAGFTEARLLDRGGSQVGVAAAPGLEILCHRGSHEWGDWRDNLRLGKVPAASHWQAKGRVHAGFARHHRRLVPEVLAWIAGGFRRPGGRPRRIIVGHSLGGIAALYMAAELRAQGWTVEEVFTLGAPRGGDRSWAEWYDERIGLRSPTWKIVAVHGGEIDLVPRLPPWRWGWWHCGRPVVVAGGRIYFGRREWEAVRTGGATVAAWRFATRTVLRIGAHDVRRTTRELRRAAEGELEGEGGGRNVGRWRRRPDAWRRTRRREFREGGV